MDQPNINSSEQNTNSEPIVSPNLTNSSNKSNSFSKILIVFLLFFVFIGAGIFLGKTYFSPQTPITAIPTVSPIIPPADPTADWKTYTSKYGYQFKYPKDWEVKVSAWNEGNLQYGLQRDDETIIRFSEPNQPPHGGFPYGTSITLKIPKENLDNLPAKAWAERTTTQEIPSKVESFVVGDTESAKVLTKFEGFSTEVFIPYKGKMYELINHSFTTSDSSYKHLYNYEAIFDQILSTFKFTDQVETTGTENWKKYTNTKFGFEFLYPSNLAVSGDDLGEQGYITTKNNNHINIRIVQDNSPTIADYLVKTDKISQTSFEGEPSIEVQSTKKTVINNLNCIQRKEYLNAADITQTTTYFKSKSTVVILTLSPIPGNPLSEDENLYDQILSTFKFTQ